MDFSKMTKKQLVAFLHRDDVQCFYVTLRWPKIDLVLSCQREWRRLEKKRLQEEYDNKCDYCNCALHDCSLCGVSSFDVAENGEPIC